MKNFWKFVKSSGIYFVGTVMIKLVTFILLPIYTKHIDPSDMGTFDVASAYVTFLCSVLYLDIWAGIMRFMYEHTTEEGKRKPVTCGMAIFAVSTIFYTLIMTGVGIINHVPYIQYMFFYGLLSNLQSVYSYIARAKGKNVLYAVSGMIGSIMTTVLNVVLIVVFDCDYSVLFISPCVGYLINIIIIEVPLKVRHMIRRESFDKEIFKQMFRFSIPLCVNSVAYWFLTSYNRVAITGYFGTAANGIYSIAGRFSSVISLFTSCFNMAWQEMAYAKEAKNQENKGKFYTVAVNTFLQFLCMGLLMILPFIKIIYPIMINESYGAGINMVPLYLAATVTSAVSSFLGNLFSALKKNNVLFYTTVLGSVTNVILVHLLMPVLGVQGASFALLMGFLVNVMFRLIILRKEIGLNIDVKVIAVIVVLFAITMYVYITQNLLINGIIFLVNVCVAVYLFKAYLVEIFKSIKERFCR